MRLRVDGRVFGEAERRRRRLGGARLHLHHRGRRGKDGDCREREEDSVSGLTLLL